MNKRFSSLSKNKNFKVSYDALQQKYIIDVLSDLRFEVNDSDVNWQTYDYEKEQIVKKPTKKERDKYFDDLEKYFLKKLEETK